MENFRRSLKYLWAYRKRLAVSVVCVAIIAALWGGGLGMIGPVLRVLINEEGLHGWAYARLGGARLGARLSVTKLPAQTEIEPGKHLAFVLTVSNVNGKGPAATAGIKETQRIIGFHDRGEQNRLIRGDELLKILALFPTDGKVALRVQDVDKGEIVRRDLVLADPKTSSRLLGEIVRLIPQPRTPDEKFRILLALLATILVMTYLRDLFRFIQEYLVETAVYRAIIDLRSETYNVALHLPLTFYSEKGTTDTMSRFVKDTNVLARAQVTLFGKTIAEPAKAIAAVVVAFLYSWELTLLAMVAGPPTIVLIRKFGKRMRRASKKALEGWAGLLGVLEETLTGIRVVKAYTMEGKERRRFFRANRTLYSQQKRIARIDAATGPTVESLGITAAVLAGAVGGYWTFRGKMDPEDFFIVMGCLVAMFDPVRKLARVVTRFQGADAAAGRIFEVQDRQQERSLPGAPRIPRHTESIELRNVTFRYPNAAEDALRDLNFRIEAGRSVAIVGPNGCGKTTLISLIPRLIDPDSGQVLIDGNDVSQYSMRSLRRQIALVTQDTVLFHATIAENIAYGLHRGDHDDVLSAAKQAFVDEFVRDLPHGYDTMVGEHGATLSGGQRQRIAIARAILRDPAILIFDEATSQIDAESEKRIHQAMENFVKGRTTLMVAHRFATVLQADYVAVMDDGQIIETGKHHELLDRCDLYRQLYQTQLGDTMS